MRRKHLVILPVILALCWTAVATAQEEPPAQDDPPAQEDSPAEVQEPPLLVEGRSLLDELDQLNVRIVDLERQAKEASGEDREALELRTADGKILALRVIDQLVANLLKQEKAGLDASDMRERVEEVLVELGPAIVRHLDAADERLAGLQADRDGVDPADLPALEGRIGRAVDWLDTVFAAYCDLVEDLEKIGLDAVESREDLSSRLTGRADLLEGRIEIVNQQLGERKKQASDNPEDKSHQPVIQALETRLNTETRGLTDLLGLMDRSGLETSKQRQLLIKSTGEVTTDVFRKNVLIGLVDGWIEDGQHWLRRRGPAIGFRVITVILILTVFWILSHICRYLVSLRGSRSRVKKSQLVQNMMQGLTGRIVMLIGIFVALSAFGVEIGPLLAGLGIAGFIVGFALQDSLSNFASGVMILGYRPYDIGDFIEAGGVFGKVSDMSLVSTTILTIDNQTLIVPNTKIWGDVIKNITHQNQRRVDMKFRISYSEDVDRAEEVLLAILADHQKILADPAPAVRLHELGEYAMEIIVRPWVETSDYWDVYWDVTREVKRRFDAEGISIAVLQPAVCLPRDD